MNPNPFVKSDARLVRDALRDRGDGFERLVHRYQGKAYAVARAAGVSPSTIEDVVQESFLRALRSLPELRDPARFSPWFLAIVRNCAFSEMRERRGRGTERLSAEPSIDDPGFAGLETAELRERLWAAVAQLSPGAREAICLYYQEGLSVRQVARSLDLSVSAVKVRLHEGRKQLRERLWRELGPALRGAMPSSREMRRRGRALTLLALSAVSSEWLLRAKVAAATISGAAAGATAATSSVGRRKLHERFYCDRSERRECKENSGGRGGFLARGRSQHRRPDLRRPCGPDDFESLGWPRRWYGGAVDRTS